MRDETRTGVVWQNGTQCSVTLGSQTVTVHKDAQPTVATHDELLSGKLDTLIVELFEIATLAEIYAVILEGRLDPADRIQVREAGRLHRPSIPRLFGGGRGSPFCIWLRSGGVIASTAGCPRYEARFDTFLLHGFPEPLRQKISEHMDLSLVYQAVLQLSQLPCDCGTGDEEPEHHRNIQTFRRVNHPFATVECWAVVGRCRVCGRAWTFEGSGDSHYSYHFSVRPFTPELRAG